MRYSKERKRMLCKICKKYMKGYGFLSFSIRFGNKYGKKLMHTTTKTGIDAAKTASKKVVQKTAEATEDLFGKK